MLKHNIQGAKRVDVIYTASQLFHYCFSQRAAFNIVAFGAKGDGKTLNTGSIQKTKHIKVYQEQ